MICLLSPLNGQRWKYNKELIGVDYGGSLDKVMNYKKLPKEARPYFEDMVYIRFGSFTSGRGFVNVIATDLDSCLIISHSPKEVSVGDFFLCSHEVTNAEYREFTTWVLEKSLQAKFLIPMAVSLAFGVLFATMITLILVPSLYMILEDIKSIPKLFRRSAVIKASASEATV